MTTQRYFRIGIRAFTIVELMVSIAIMSLMTTVLLTRYPETATRLTLANNSHMLALLIREAQVRGSAVDSVGGSVGGYGVFLNSATPDQVILFNDIVDPSIPKPLGVSVGDGIYQDTEPDETASVTKLQTGFSFAKLCLPETPTSTTFTCGSTHTPNVTTLTISFTRPNPNAQIYVNGDRSTKYSSACIQLSSPSSPEFGHIRSVQVNRSGMISTTVTSCD